MKNVKKKFSYKAVFCLVVLMGMAMIVSLKSNSHMSNTKNLGVAHKTNYIALQAGIPQPQVRVVDKVVDVATRAWEGSTREAAKFVAYEVAGYAVERLLEWLYVKNTIEVSAKIINLKKEIMLDSLD
jgi:hypothetical protein